MQPPRRRSSTARKFLARRVTLAGSTRPTPCAAAALPTEARPNGSSRIVQESAWWCRTTTAVLILPNVLQYAIGRGQATGEVFRRNRLPEWLLLRPAARADNRPPPRA